MIINHVYLNSLKRFNVAIISVYLLVLNSGALASVLDNPGDDGINSNSSMLLAALIEDEKRPQKQPMEESGREKQRSSWAFYLDNDLFASPGKDRDYTGGISMTLSGANAKDYVVSIDPALDVINDWLGVNETTGLNLHSFEFGLTVFTPEDIFSSQALVDDRPYASLMYVSNTRQSINRARRFSTLSSLTLGFIGLKLAGEVQNKIHKLIDSDEAKGWDNQISEGGELTFRYSLSRQHVRWSNYAADNTDYEVKTATRASIGYLSDISWSISGRLGKINTPWWSFNPQTAEYTEKSAPVSNVNHRRSVNELYIWAGMSIHYRAYNALLQGQFKDSKVTYASDELDHIIGEVWLGVTSEMENGIRLSYFLRGQTSEIKSGSGSRNPVWGGVIISRTI